MLKVPTSPRIKKISPHTRIPGTLRMPYLRETHGGHHLKCSRCLGPINQFYYVHQCKSIPHNWCNRCLPQMGKCKRCGHFYYEIYHP